MIDLATRIPSTKRLNPRNYKLLLRNAIGDLLPPELINAPKRGFVIPLKLWLRNQLRPLTEQLLSRERLAAQGIFQPEFHDWAVRPHLDGKVDNTPLVWRALMFQVWHNEFIENFVSRTESLSS
jgi:asparagine synthase (glutamine-hydrolysing)